MDSITVYLPVVFESEVFTGDGSTPYSLVTRYGPCNCLHPTATELTDSEVVLEYVYKASLTSSTNVLMLIEFSSFSKSTFFRSTSLVS